YHPSAKRVILIIDETSRLTSVGGVVSKTTKEVTDEFINVLRTLKNPNVFMLHAVALVGTESVREVLCTHNTPGRSSQIFPFTASGAFNAGQFSEAEAKKLFDQFASVYNSDGLSSADISADIFDLTLGHKGLVGCGRFIEDSFDGDTPITTVNQWRAQTTNELRRHIGLIPFFD
ncbi:hypothetical protein BGX27_003671, partial [Mortierella sp. AM989]